MTVTTDFPHLLTEQTDKVFWITFNRPEKLNCFSDPMLDAIVAMLDELERDDSVSVIVFRGSGRAFSSGYDISPDVPRPTNSEEARRWANRRYAYIDRVWNIPKPFIAQVHGYCLAGASDLANTCDLTVASEDAVFGYPAIRWGGHTHRLTYAWTMPMKKARELMYTGDNITAQEALALGMVNKVVPREQLQAETAALAERIALTPLSGLITNKLSLNFADEVRGYRQSMAFTNQIANTNMFRDIEFFNIAREQGLKAALDHRDRPFD